MDSKRDRYGPAPFFVVAALLVCALFIGAPGAQAEELDTGPQLVDVLLSNDARVIAAVIEAVAAVDVAEQLGIYCYESQARVESTNARALPAEHFMRFRDESGHRANVARRCDDDLSLNDLMPAREWSTDHPLRC